MPACGQMGIGLALYPDVIHYLNIGFSEPPPVASDFGFQCIKTILPVCFEPGFEGRDLDNLFKDFTMPKVLDEFDIIDCFEVPGQKLQVGEITKKQTELYSKFGGHSPELDTIVREFRLQTLVTNLKNCQATKKWFGWPWFWQSKPIPRPET